MADNELEQELIQQLLLANLVNRGLDEEFSEYFQELQETSQVDMSEYGFKQMKEWLSQFLQQRNLPLINIKEDIEAQEPEQPQQAVENNNVSASYNQPLLEPRSSSDEKKQVYQQKNEQDINYNNQNNNYNNTNNNSPYHSQQPQQQPFQKPLQVQQFNPDFDESLINALDMIPPSNNGNFDPDFLDYDLEDIPFPPKKEQQQTQPQPQQQYQQPQYPPQTIQQVQQYPIQLPPQQIQVQQEQRVQQQQQQQYSSYQGEAAIDQVQKYPNLPQKQQLHQARSFTEGQGDNQEYLAKKDDLSNTVNDAKRSFGTPSYPPQNQIQAPINTNTNIQKTNPEPFKPAQSTYLQNPDISMMPDFKPAVGMNLTQQFGMDISIIGKEDEPSKFITTEEQIKLIEQFEKQLQDREYLNASQIIECQKMELNKIGKFMKTYPEKKPKVSIQSYRVFEEGFLKQNYVLYTVSISELGWTCYRRYSDFKILRDIFEDQYPGYFVPPLPRKTISRKFEPEYLEKRMKILEQFMEAVLESELLRNSQYLEDFLFIQDEAKYRRVASNVKEMPLELNQFFSIDGKINCQNSTNFQTYGAAFRNYTQNLTTLYGKAKHLTKEVVKNLDDSQKSLKNLSGVFSELSKITSEFNQRNKIGVNTYLQKQYEENSKFLNEYADFLEKQQKLFKNYIYLKMRYEKKVCAVFEEMSNKRNRLMASFQDAFTKIGQKKQKMFDKKDIRTWELPPNLPVDQMVLLQDQKLAFKYMLPRETQLVKQMNKKINFFNSNLFYETRKYLKIRETKISSDFIQFTAENGDHLNRLKEYHDQHLQRLNQIVLDSQQNIIQQMEDDRKVIDQSVNGTFLTDAQCQIRKVMF